MIGIKVLHTTPIFCKYQILPYELLIKQAQLSFMHSVFNNYAPTSFSNTWTLNVDRAHQHNLRNASDYYLIQPRIEFFKKSPLYALPSALNELSPFIKLHANRITFRWALKAHLLEQIQNA